MARHGVLDEEMGPPFRERPWTQIRDMYVTLGWPELQPLIEIVQSVLDSGGPGRMAATTSMHDLWVARRVAEGPMSAVDLVKVLSFTSMRLVTPDEVVIEHTSHSGQQESIGCDAVDAVPLFWRFVGEKWGIEPWRWDTMSDAQRHVVLLASEEAELWETTSPSTVADERGTRQVPGLALDDAQSAVVRLLQLGVIELWDGSNLDQPLDEDELADVFANSMLWQDPSARPQPELALTPAGLTWYYATPEGDGDEIRTAPTGPDTVGS